jgi:MerR family transcriptional regulator/heat shock protein HspR
MSNTEPVITIGNVAERLGISVSTVRKYEAEGLIIPHRTDSGHRLFSFEDIERIRIIQNMIQNLGLNIEGIRRLQAMIPCWELLPCTEEMRKNCPAFSDSTRPCWMIKDLECAEDRSKCRSCPVYRLGAQCIEDIKQVVYGRLNNNNK